MARPVPQRTFSRTAVLPSSGAHRLSARTPSVGSLYVFCLSGHGALWPALGGEPPNTGLASLRRQLGQEPVTVGHYRPFHHLAVSDGEEGR